MSKRVIEVSEIDWIIQNQIKSDNQATLVTAHRAWYAIIWSIINRLNFSIQHRPICLSILRRIFALWSMVRPLSLYKSSKEFQFRGKKGQQICQAIGTQRLVIITLQQSLRHLPDMSDSRRSRVIQDLQKNLREIDEEEELMRKCLLNGGIALTAEAFELITLRCESWVKVVLGPVLSEEFSHQYRLGTDAIESFILVAKMPMDSLMN